MNATRSAQVFGGAAPPISSATSLSDVLMSVTSTTPAVAGRSTTVHEVPSQRTSSEPAIVNGFGRGSPERSALKERGHERVAVGGHRRPDRPAAGVARQATGRRARSAAS